MRAASERRSSALRESWRLGMSIFREAGLYAIMNVPFEYVEVRDHDHR